MADVNPYDGLAGRAFWRSAAHGTHPLDPADLYLKRFDLGQADRITTAGSCFAQHIARALRGVGLNVIDCEPAPRGLPPKDHADFGYGLYSARFANIYTARQLLQLLEEAFEGRNSPDPVWKRSGRFYDSMRPSVEPEGLDSPETVIAHRAFHLTKVREMIRQTDVFIFTLGLTECWEHRQSGWIFPTAPGTIAGSFDPDIYHFRNLTYPEVIADMERAMAIITAHAARQVRFLFTVSPVPLTATASAEHVQVATVYSKSVLRAVVGDLVARHPDTGYFPSYEMVTAPASRGVFYDANMRSVNRGGVDIIMRSFLRSHGLTGQAAAPGGPEAAAQSAEMPAELSDNLICEEALLEAFAPGKPG